MSPIKACVALSRCWPPGFASSQEVADEAPAAAPTARRHCKYPKPWFLTPSSTRTSPSRRTPRSRFAATFL